MLVCNTAGTLRHLQRPDIYKIFSKRLILLQFFCLRSACPPSPPHDTHTSIAIQRVDCTHPVMRQMPPPDSGICISMSAHSVRTSPYRYVASHAQLDSTGRGHVLIPDLVVYLQELLREGCWLRRYVFTSKMSN